MHEQNNKCKENIIRELLKVQAQITVTPLVRHGEPKVSCIDSCIKQNKGCHDHGYGCDTFWESGCSRNRCNFTLTQIICVEIPITFDAEVNIKEGIVCCGRPEIKNQDVSEKEKQFYMQMI